MTMLRLGREQPRIRRELSRRIGYTNGLHDIFRFARVVTYAHSIAPATDASLRAAIMDSEQVKGTKYVDGVIDAARALGLLTKVGGRLTLSDKGYALYGVQQMSKSPELQRAMMLNAVLDSDGEATLNLLDLIASGVSSSSLGKSLFERMLRIIDLRREWAEEKIPIKLVRDVILGDLADSRSRLEKAIAIDRKPTQSHTWSTYREGQRLTAEQRVQRFYDHTINPRRGWLRDLGCIEEQGRNQYWITEAGKRLLNSFKRASCYSTSVFILPLSPDLMDLLGVGLHDSTHDLFWYATASYYANPAIQAQLTTTEHFKLINSIYPHVKLHLFNEATIESLYHVISSLLAVKGQYIGRSIFEKQLDDVGQAYPGSMYRLRQRYGGSGYIAMKTSFGKDSISACQ